MGGMALTVHSFKLIMRELIAKDPSFRETLKKRVKDIPLSERGN